MIPKGLSIGDIIRNFNTLSLDMTAEEYNTWLKIKVDHESLLRLANEVQEQINKKRMNNEYNKEDLYECDEDGCVYSGNLFTEDEVEEEDN